MTAAQADQWAAVQRSATQNRCRCALQPAMTALELRTLGGGCTMPSHCCPTLDAYRRRVGLLPMPELSPAAPRKVRAPRYDPFQSQVVKRDR